MKIRQSTTHGRNLGSNSTTGYYASFLAFFPPKINFIPPKRTRAPGGGVLSQNVGPQNELFPSETYSRLGEGGEVLREFRPEKYTFWSEIDFF